MKELEIKEIIQCGDTFLLKFDCPNCNKDLLTGFPVGSACECGYNLKDCIISPPKNRINKRLLVGTKRKGRIGKQIVKNLFAMQEGLVCLL